MCGNLMLRGKEAFEVLQTLCSSKKIYIDRPHLSLLNTVIVRSLSRVRFFATHGMQHARLFCPPLSPRVRSKLCPLSQWCYLTISSFAADFSICLQSFPESGSFPMSQFSPSPGQSITTTASASVFQWILMVEFPDWLVWSLLCPRDSQNSSPALQLKKTSIIWHSNFFMVQNSHLHMTTRKIIALTIWTFVSKVISLLFNTLPRSGIISFQAKCLCFVLFFFNYMAALTVCSDFGAQENKICHCFHFFPIYLPWSDGNGYAMILDFWMLSFKPAFSLSFFMLIKSLFSSSSLSAFRVVSYANLRLIFLPAILIPVCD